MNKSILLLGSQHGNELLGEKLQTYITNHHPQLLTRVDYVLANPRARRRYDRYIESDMNRSFNIPVTTYESKQAEKILLHIKKQGYELVLDLHTTTANQPPCVIIGKLHPAVKKYLRSATITQIVKMSSQIAQHSLIGNCPRAVSIEVNEEQVDKTFLESIVRSLTAFLTHDQLNEQVTVFEVEKLLEPKDLQNQAPVSVANFQLCKNKFYPILFGEVAYQNDGSYLGFKAKKKYQLTV